MKSGSKSITFSLINSTFEVSVLVKIKQSLVGCLWVKKEPTTNDSNLQTIESNLIETIEVLI